MKIIIMLIALAIIAFAFIPDEVDEKRGCIASANQSTDRAANLKVCEGL